MLILKFAAKVVHFFYINICFLAKNILILTPFSNNMFYSMKPDESYSHYLHFTPRDEQWGIVCTTVGYQKVPPHSPYPPIDRHPDDYYFRKGVGRRLNEYQLVYIVEGNGWFESEHCTKQIVRAGTMFMLFPGEWHYYAPNPETGWKEYWVGFKGRFIDERLTMGFLSKSRPLAAIGTDLHVVSLYDEIIHNSQNEISGYQNYITGIILHILGGIVFRVNERNFEQKEFVKIIDDARSMMKASIGKNISPEQIAKQIGVGYSWFRRIFKEYTGISPAQYQQHLRLAEAKELLANSSRSISTIAYDLGFANSNQLSTFFRQHEGISPRVFREGFRLK